MASKVATTTKEPIGRVGQRRQVVIPREMLETIHLQEGDFVAFSTQGNGVLMKPKQVVNRDDYTPAKGSCSSAGGFDYGLTHGCRELLAFLAC